MLSADELRQLDRLHLHSANASAAATVGGARLARLRGFSTEFHDLRQYQPGDDPRSVDWTVYARLGQLVTRTYRATAELKVHLLLDVSASMRNGTPGKLSAAVKVAAVLAYAALRARDAVGLATFAEGLSLRLSPSSGRAQLFRIFSALNEARAEGGTALASSLAQYAALETGPGLAVVISDFFDADGVLVGLRTLQHRGLTPAVVQVLSRDEVHPAFGDDVELTDMELPGAVPLVADAETIGAYALALAEDRAAIRAACHTQALPHVQLLSSDSFADMLLACSRGGLFVAQC